MRLLPVFLSLTLLSACAVVEKKGILVDVEPGTPMDASDLRQHCDLNDTAACALAGLKNTPLPDPRYSFVQGLAPADRAVFSVLIPKGAKLSWFVYDRELTSLTKLFTVNPVSRGDSRWAVQRLDVRGLVPGRTYEILAGDADGRLLDDRRFHTLANDERNLRVSLIGGWRFASPLEQRRLVAQALAEHPQLLVLAGSTVDATLPANLSSIKGKAAADFFFSRHAEARSRFELGLARDLIPVIAQWNDDEFGRANGDRSFPQRDQAREQLEQFFPTWADETTVVTGPGISRELQFRHQDLAIIDDLSFRRAPAEGEPVCTITKKKKEVCRPGRPVPAPPGTRYGGILRDWVNDRAAKADRPLWILAGGPTLLAQKPEWNFEKMLDSPSLSHPPETAWLATIEGTRNGGLRLTGAEEVQKTHIFR